MCSSGQYREWDVRKKVFGRISIYNALVCLYVNMLLQGYRIRNRTEISIYPFVSLPLHFSIKFHYPLPYQPIHPYLHIDILCRIPITITKIIHLVIYLSISIFFLSYLNTGDEFRIERKKE